MNIRTPLFAAALALLSHGAAYAHGYKLGDIAIGHPWARATVAGQPTGGGFMTLDNQGKDDKLLSISADVSEKVELHFMEMKDNVMRMREVDGGVPLPAGKKVLLQAGGYHIMFVKLKAPLKEGTSFPATLKFEKAGDVKVEFKVEPVNFAPNGAAAHQHSH